MQLNDWAIKFSGAEFDGNTAEKLKTFFNNIWNSPAEYKVLMARRMFNLHFAMKKSIQAENNEQYLQKGIMSNTAFLLSGKNIVYYYLLRGEFPRILICDDILLHGRSILRLINSLEGIVLYYLSKTESQFEKETVLHELRKSILIYVFAQNAEGVLISSDYQLLAAQRLSLKELRSLSKEFSHYIQRCGVANTSYVLSITLPIGSLSWEKEMPTGAEGSFAYMGFRQKLFARYERESILDTIRIRYSRERYPQKEICTGLTLFGDIPFDSFDSLCRDLSDYLGTFAVYKRMTELLALETEEKELIRSRGQLVTFLYSTIALADFLREKMHLDDNDLVRVLLSSDYEKVAANFAGGERFVFEIVALINTISQDHQFVRCLKQMLSRVSIGRLIFNQENSTVSFQPIVEDGHTDDMEEDSLSLPYRYVQDIFYDVGMDGEYDAYQCKTGRKIFDSRSTGYDNITLGKYLQLIEKYGVKDIPGIGYMYGLMDEGQLTLNIEGNMEDCTIRTILKAGELATYVLPMRYSVFIPAFSMLERTCGLKEPFLQGEISGFIDYLQDHCFAIDNIPKNQDLKCLKNLKEDKQRLLQIYSIGQKFSDWDLSLKRPEQTEENRAVFYEELLKYVEESLRRAYYISCIRDYLAFKKTGRQNDEQ
ncbi:hypothetical protein SAMN04487833_1015 [Sarcina sp. DSM 11001]|uniref:hypothetical protein n=1 Tax=Sarcina sp. DSM 11001 TaxID=1798184 RepID=UPI000890BA0A|nr:hypothetical protein [Sarcina sp. DSM 11001]SDK24052.1 hypothetical protein SAMN04487833_1015 [Sarcina sp. DSM 11001]